MFTGMRWQRFGDREAADDAPPDPAAYPEQRAPELVKQQTGPAIHTARPAGPTRQASAGRSTSRRSSADQKPASKPRVNLPWPNGNPNTTYPEFNLDRSKIGHISIRVIDKQQ